MRGTIDKAKVGDDYFQDEDSIESCGIDLVYISSYHSNGIEVYGNKALRDVLVELINENADRINRTLNK